MRMPATVSRWMRCCLLQQTLLRNMVFAVQVSMWSLQKKPEFKQKFPELVDEPQQPEVSPCYAIDVRLCKSNPSRLTDRVISCWQTTTRVSYSSFNKPQ